MMEANRIGEGMRSRIVTVRSSALTYSATLLPRSGKGFTLVEMIIVIVITGIISGMVAMFIRAPVQGYVDSARRAEMSDIADTALRRLARDVRTAVPNSLRTPNPANSQFIEFLPTQDGGRYRVTPGAGALCGGAVAGNTDGDALSFDNTDTCFEIIGPPMTFAVGDAIVIGSTQSDGSLPYLPVNNAQSVRRMVALAGAGLQIVRITASAVPFPAASQLNGYRFAVVPAAQEAVTYSCGNPGVDANGDGSGTLTRYWKYGFLGAPSATPGGTSAILADKVSACQFTYNTSNARNSLLAVRLTITRGGESVNLYQEIHVNNIP